MRKKALLFILALVVMLTPLVPVAFAQEQEPEAPLAVFFMNMAKT